MTDSNGVPRLLAPGQKVRVYVNRWGLLQDHVWIADEEDNPLGMADRIEAAFWVDPEAIKEAATAKLVDMAEVLHDTRSRHRKDASAVNDKPCRTRIVLEV